MNRESEAKLLEFAAAQQRAFVPADWNVFPHPDRNELAATALFLAGTDWYHHRGELLKVSDLLAPGFQGRLSELVARTGFDLSRFSNQLRRLLDHAEATS